MTKVTLSGLPALLPETAPAPRQIEERGQHGDYWILSETEREKGFVRPLQVTYRHAGCGLSTVMAMAIAETFARDPTFYSHTFCVHCRTHRPLVEFHWVEDDQPVGS
jgi:hypothetical protein